MLQALAIPEEYGGQGFTFIELGIVLEEMGRVLLCAPYFASVVLAANAILNVGTDDAEAGAAARHRERRHDRDARVHRAVGQVGRRRHHDGGARRATAASFTLSGEKMFVIDGFTADLIVVVARTAGTTGTDGISFFTVRGDADGLTRTALSDDGHDAQAGEARVQQRRGAAARQHRRRLRRRSSKTLDQAAVALANEMMGGAQKVLEMSVEYAKVRVQFGRPIGSFQAIKHKCADMLLEVESGKSAAYYASWAAAEDNDELPVVAALVEGVLLGGVLPRDRREHPDPRRHRLHVGAPRAPVLQARQELRDLPRRPDVPPRAARAAHRHLSRAARSPSPRSTPIGASAGPAPSGRCRFDVAALVRGFDADIVVVPEAFRFDDGTSLLDPLEAEGWTVRTTHFVRIWSRGRGAPGDVRPAGGWELAVCTRLPVARLARAADGRGVP